jgi:hypothetical protein
MLTLRASGNQLVEGQLSEDLPALSVSIRTQVYVLPDAEVCSVRSTCRILTSLIVTPSLEVSLAAM